MNSQIILRLSPLLCIIAKLIHIIDIMRKQFRKSVPVIACIMLQFCVTSLHADRVVFTYDASGNRISSQKEISVRSLSSSNQEQVSPLMETLSHHRITVYPNPTDGPLRIDISGLSGTQGSSITIYNMLGSIVYYESDIRESNDLDLTPYPAGMYLMILRLEGETSTWKIVRN